MKNVIKTITILSLAAASFSTLQAAEKSGEELFKANCTACHATVHPKDESKQVAPPIMGAVRHVKNRFATKDDAVKFIVDYAQNPTKEKAACDAESIKKFGVMPSLKGAVSLEDLKKIAEYVYDTYPNGQGKGKGKGYGHGKGKHQGEGCQAEGQQGKGHGQGQGQGRGHGMGHGQGHGKGMGQGHGKGMGHGQSQGRGHGMGHGQGE